MNIARTLAVARKETIHILRDPRSLYLALGIPVMLMILVGYALSLDVDNIPLAVWDQDRSPQSRELIDRLTSSGYFRLVLNVNSYKEIVDAIDTREATIGITVPWGFARDLRKESGADVQAVVDGSDASRANIAIGYLTAIVTIYRTDLRFAELERQAVTRVEPPLDPRITLLYNPELISRINLVPGLIAMIMMVIAALLTSLTIVRERESGTMEQLISTPVKAEEMVTGKLLPYFALGYVDLTVVYLVSQFVFDVPFRGSLVLMFLFSGFFLVAALSLGLLISTIADTQVFATQLALIGSLLPSFLLSGFVFPIGNMPYFVQAFTYVVPARYYITILRGIFLKGVGAEVLLYPVIMMVIFGSITSFAASRNLRKKLL